MLSLKKLLCKLLQRENEFPKVVWTGEWYMKASQTVDLSATPISSAPHGIILTWNYYSDDQVRDYNMHYSFVPKTHIQNFDGVGIDFFLGSSSFGTSIACKYLYISNTSIKGNDANTKSGTGANNIKYNNANHVLTQVILI